MEKVIINKGDTSLITTHFRHSEFYSKSKDAPASHTFPQALVEAAQILRSYCQVPFRVTSTFRTMSHERQIIEHHNATHPPHEHMSLGLVSSSQHVKGRAMDIQPVGPKAAQVMKVLQDDFLQQGPHFRRLRQLGVTGFGIYPTFIHLDVRTEEGNQLDRLGHFAFWDNRPKSAKKTLPKSIAKSPAASVASR